MLLTLVPLLTGVETFKEGRNARLVVDIDGAFTFEHQQVNNCFFFNR